MTRPPEERTVLVTGATDGLGRATVHELARLGTTVIVHGRRRERAEAVAEEVAAAGGGDRVSVHVADLASLAHVRALAAEVERDHERLDVLVNNAGLISPQRRESDDGYELTFAVNYLSHFLLTGFLLPLLRRSAPVRIVNVASIGQAPLDFDDLMLERRYDDFRAYAQSKLAQIMHAFELAERVRRAGEEQVTANALHPATLMDTKMVRESFGRARSTVAEGVEAVVRLAVGEEVEGVSGRFFNGTREGVAHPQAYDPDARRRLWEVSEKLLADAG
jgi:NAD(P)-dependent dehydrogenase (short-subunit alcohol dehydrogenase family)